MSILFTHRMHAYRWLVLALFAVLPAITCAQTVTGVGFAPIEIHDPVSGVSMPGYVFYPSAKKGQRVPRVMFITVASPGLPWRNVHQSLR